MKRPAVWFSGGLFVLMVLGGIYLPLVPFGVQTDAVAMPDLVFIIIAAWVLRRPEAAPFMLVLALALLADVMLSGPLGLGALLLLAASEFLRGQRNAHAPQPFWLEWLSVSMIYAVVLFVQRLALTLAFVPLPGLRTDVGVFFSTVAFYPVITALLHWVLRIRAANRSERSSRLGRVA